MVGALLGVVAAWLLLVHTWRLAGLPEPTIGPVDLQLYADALLYSTPLTLLLLYKPGYARKAKLKRGRHR